MRRGNDFIALLDAEQQQRDVQSRCAAVEGDAMFRTTILGEIFFELDDVRAETERAGVEVAGDGGVNFFAQRTDLRREVEIRDFIVHLILISGR
jgi:hypothetical protein